jgi:hypothetical protein
MPTKPEIITFLIADNVMQERGSNKWSAIGIFDRIYSSKFPCLHANMALYVKLADAEGEYDIRVEFLALHRFVWVKIKRLPTLKAL